MRTAFYAGIALSQRSRPVSQFVASRVQVASASVVGSSDPQPTFIMTNMDHFRLHPLLHRVLDWVPALLSVLMIALESTATMSAANTSRFLYPLWVQLFGTPSPEHWEEVHHLIRKTGHFVGYGLVSLAFFYSWRQTLHRMAIQHWTLWRRASVLAVLSTLVIASLDEYHQSFLPSRTSSPIDVGIDLCGAIAFQLVLLFIIQWFARRPGYRAA
jgi:VanZ family protein